MFNNLIWLFMFLMIAMFAAVIAMSLQCRKQTERYVKLEEWAEDWLKRLEQKVEAADFRANLVSEEVKAFEELLPKDGKGEILRNHILLQQMNDEMERGLKMEKEWNDGLSSILNYGKPITEVNKNE